jgi:hypothetical protein
MISASLMQEEYRRQLNRVDAAHGSRVPVIEADGFLNQGIDIVFENLSTKFQLHSTATNHLRQLEEKRVKLKPKKFDKDSVYIDYPSNFYLLTNQFVKACRKDCDTERVLDIYIVQSSDLNQSLKDPNWRPSFEWEQTIAEQAGNSLIVYHMCDFDVKEVRIDYLRKPNHIATPSLLQDGTSYVKDGKTITSNIDFEVTSTFFWRKAVEVAVLLTLTSLGDNMDYQAELSRILNLDKIFI